MKTALLGLRGASPEAIIVIGAYLPSAVFTQWARKLGVDALIVNISFVGTNALADALGPAGEGVYVTQVVPFPEGDAMPLLAEYRAALAAHDPLAAAAFGSLEGYIAGRLTVDVLRRLGPEPTREGFLAALAGVGAFDIGGFVLRYGAGRQPRLGPGVPDHDPRRRQHRAGRGHGAMSAPDAPPPAARRGSACRPSSTSPSPARWR